jgi:hypothetical protein
MPVPIILIGTEVPWRVRKTEQNFSLYCLPYCPYIPSDLCQPGVTTNICVKRMTIQVLENTKYYTAGIKCTALRRSEGGQTVGLLSTA